MNTSLAVAAEKAPALTLADVRRMKISLPPLSGAYPRTDDEVAQTRAAIARLDVPASPDWIKGRIGTFLMHFYVSGLPAPAVRAISDDWAATLEDFPQWAIEAACLWWIGPDNDKSGVKPSPARSPAAPRPKPGCCALQRARLSAGSATATTRPPS